MFEFEVSVHRATTALKKLNRRRKDLIDEAVRVCTYCDTDHTVQTSNCTRSKMNTLVQRTLRYSSF